MATQHTMPYTAILSIASKALSLPTDYEAIPSVLAIVDNTNETEAGHYRVWTGGTYGYLADLARIAADEIDACPFSYTWNAMHEYRLGERLHAYWLRRSQFSNAFRLQANEIYEQGLANHRHQEEPLIQKI